MQSTQDVGGDRKERVQCDFATARTVTLPAGWRKAAPAYKVQATRYKELSQQLQGSHKLYGTSYQATRHVLRSNL